MLNFFSNHKVCECNSLGKYNSRVWDTRRDELKKYHNCCHFLSPYSACNFKRYCLVTLVQFNVKYTRTLGRIFSSIKLFTKTFSRARLFIKIGCVVHYSCINGGSVFISANYIGFVVSFVGVTRINWRAIFVSINITRITIAFYAILDYKFTKWILIVILAYGEHRGWSFASFVTRCGLVMRVSLSRQYACVRNVLIIAEITLRHSKMIRNWIILKVITIVRPVTVYDGPLNFQL